MRDSHDVMPSDAMEAADLDACFRAIAGEDARLEPPPALAARTLAAWEAARGPARPHDPGPSRRLRPLVRTVRPGWMAGRVGLPAALAAALVLAAVLPRPLMPGPRPKPTPRPGVTRVEAKEDIGLPAPVVDSRADHAVAGPLRVAAAPEPRAPRRRVRPAGRQAPSAETLRFVTLAPDAERELAGGFELSRVRVPRHVLVGLGLLDASHRDDDPEASIEADVAFSEDGQAKAIRMTPARFAR